MYIITIIFVYILFNNHITSFNIWGENVLYTIPYPYKRFKSMEVLLLPVKPDDSTIATTF